MSHDALIDRLSGSVETSLLGAIRYYNSDGELHRTDGPAVIYRCGTKFWCQRGERHRLDGPAVIYSDGSEVWYRNGRIHRVGGAAVSYPSGEQHWLQNGQYHRTDGPASIFRRARYWYLNGEEVSEEEFNQRIASGEYRDP